MHTENKYNPNGGPRTPAGRAISSQNATRHGCCSEATLIVAGEKIEDYQALEAVWFKAYNPNEDAEKALVQALVNAEWFLARSVRNMAEVEASIFEVEPNPLKWTEEHHKALARFQRYQTARTNLAIKARKAVEDYRKNRVAEVMKQEKHEIQKKKAEPEPSIEDLIEQMMQGKDPDPDLGPDLDTDLEAQP